MRDGFSVTVVEVPTSKKWDGIVVDQKPKGGTKAQSGSAVEIDVGKSPGGGNHPRSATRTYRGVA